MNNRPKKDSGLLTLSVYDAAFIEWQLRHGELNALAGVLVCDEGSRIWR